MKIKRINPSSPPTIYKADELLSWGKYRGRTFVFASNINMQNAEIYMVTDKHNYDDSLLQFTSLSSGKVHRQWPYTSNPDMIEVECVLEWEPYLSDPGTKTND